MVAVTLYLVGTFVALAAMYFYIKFLYRKSRKGEPPLVPGSFLWGNGADFAEHAVRFLHNSRKRFGEIFTIRFMHQHLTIIMDPHSYERMVKEKAFDFDPIQKQVNHNVFSFELANARKMIKEAGKTVRGNFLTSTMQNFSNHLNTSFDKFGKVDLNQNENEKGGWSQDKLRSMASRTMFDAIFKTIFGESKLEDVFEPRTVYKNFDIFHQYFNFLWLGLPVNLFPKAVKALNVLCQQPSSSELLERKDLSEYIRFSTNYMLENSQTESDIMGHNLVYLHVNYNTFRLTFWAIYLLLENPEAYKSLSAEVHEAVRRKAEYVDDGDDVEFDLEEVENLEILDSVVKETMRVSSGVFMVRSIVEDCKFEMEDGQKYNLRKGDKVAMYPPAIHKDPEIFEDPEVYKYDRFVNATFYKNGRELKTPLLPFGSLCPGKRLAIAQTKWFLLSLLHKYDLELLPGEKTIPDAGYHGHEILPPINDVGIKYIMKDSHHRLCLV